MDTASIPEELKPYLSLYLEVLFESPVLRENGMRNYWLSLSTIILAEKEDPSSMKAAFG